MTQEYQIIIFMILFLIIIILVHHVFIQPAIQEKKRNERLAQEWSKYKQQEPRDVAIKSTQGMYNPDIDLGNTLPGDQDIKIEDSFSEVNNPITKTEFENLVESQVPTLNTYQCWLSKEFECPPKNGNYLQCTNNYIPKPDQKNCDCSNRTFEMCPFPYKISENEYYKKIGFNREKEFGY